jgi:hypothetical protein
MNLAAVMDEVAARAREITGLHAYEWPVGKINGAAAVVSYPETGIEYDGTYGRGMDRITGLPLHLAFPQPNEKFTRDTLAGWSRGTGSTSIKAALERGRYTSCGDVHVTSCTFDVTTIGGADYMVATFHLDITGAGD